MTTSYTRARRLGRDQEEDGRQELRELLDDPNADFGDIIAAAIEHAQNDPEKAEEVHEALREIAEDRRGPRSWAADRMERRRIGKDMRARRAKDARRARDEPPPFEGRPRPGGGMDPISGGRLFDPDRDYGRSGEEGQDRRTAADMALDARARQDSNFAHFARLFPNAAKIERF